MTRVGCVFLRMLTASSVACEFITFSSCRIFGMREKVHSCFLWQLACWIVQHKTRVFCDFLKKRVSFQCVHWKSGSTEAGINKSYPGRRISVDRGHLELADFSRPHKNDVKEIFSWSLCSNDAFLMIRGHWRFSWTPCIRYYWFDLHIYAD